MSLGTVGLAAVRLAVVDLAGLGLVAMGLATVGLTTIVFLCIWLWSGHKSGYCLATIDQDTVTLVGMYNVDLVNMNFICMPNMDLVAMNLVSVSNVDMITLRLMDQAAFWDIIAACGLSSLYDQCLCNLSSNRHFIIVATPMQDYRSRSSVSDSHVAR